MNIRTPNGWRRNLRVIAIALLSLVVVLAAGSLALAQVVKVNKVDSSATGSAAKRSAVNDMVAARGRINIRRHRKVRGPQHRRKHRAKQPLPAAVESAPAAALPLSPSNPATEPVDSNPPTTSMPSSGSTNPPTRSGPESGEEVTPPSEEAAPPPAEEEQPTPPAEEEPTPPAEEPTPPPANCTTTVSSVSAAQTAVNAAASGGVVCLANGSYGEVTLNASKSGAGVTLRAANPGAATINGASLSGAGLTLAYFNITNEVVVQAGAKQITILHNKITGGYFGILACASDSTTCDDVKIIGNQLQGPYGEDGIRANRYHDGNGDGIGLLVEGNEFTGIREDGNHSDCLQAVWTGDHIVFRKNYLHNNRCQGFFVKDQNSLCGSGSSGVCGPVNGIQVEDNLFLRNEEPCTSAVPAGSCGQPVYLHIFGPYTNAVISHNTIWGDGMSSLIGLREGVAAGTRVEDNAIYRFWTDTDASAAIFSDNTLCKIEGSWPTSRPGTSVECSPPFFATATDDYRLPSGRGVDWAPAEEHYGP